ncbi:hypothetical protein Taro_055613, partial [Colocasia esculenta]|nr:hypothetical protein [Colocasia esculenta]
MKRPVWLRPKQDHTTTFGAVCGKRCCHGSRTILIPERRKQGDEVSPVARGFPSPIPPGDVAVATPGANHDAPAPTTAAPATALE